MRIAYIGLSTPLFYDYRNQASKAPSDLISSPNPILDCPLGLIILYDELWFLCRSLCPENMRALPYVKFMDEHGILPDLHNMDFDSDAYAAVTDPDIGRRVQRPPYIPYRDRKTLAGDYMHKLAINWDASLDYNTQRLRIGDTIQKGDSRFFAKIMFDEELVKRLNRPNVEFIANSITQSWFEHEDNPIHKARLTELLVLEDIPNYLSVRGPYHPCFEELRNNPHLSYFRKWISDEETTFKTEELREAKETIENEIRRTQEEVFLKYLDPKVQFLSAGKTIVGAAVDLLLPGVSTVASLAESTLAYFESSKRRWQGFIVTGRRTLQKRR